MKSLLTCVTAILLAAACAVCLTSCEESGEEPTSLPVFSVASEQSTLSSDGFEFQSRGDVNDLPAVDVESLETVSGEASETEE